MKWSSSITSIGAEDVTTAAASNPVDEVGLRADLDSGLQPMQPVIDQRRTALLPALPTSFGVETTST